MLVVFSVLSCSTHVEEVQDCQSTAQVEQLLLERVVDRLGLGIDQVEIKIMVGVGHAGME